RNELSDDHINEITCLYADYIHDDESKLIIDGKEEEKICSKIFDNREFGFIKVTVERPLRLNFQASEERIQKLWEETAFKNLSESKKKKDKKAAQKEIEEGEQLQEDIIDALKKMDSEKIYKDRKIFVKDLDKILQANSLKLNSSTIKAILSSLSEKDEEAEICYDSKGNLEPDPDLRDYENIPLPSDIKLPLPYDYDKKAKPDKLNELVKDHCEEYMKKEVLPHVPDAWIDYDKTKVGYEIPINRHFYVYKPPRDLEDIEIDIKARELDIIGLLKEITEA
ncbi:MAG: SAM-dependent DNA methyltransferase, partial [Ignavibacteriaceae bacterium]